MGVCLIVCLSVCLTFLYTVCVCLCVCLSVMQSVWIEGWEGWTKGGGRPMDRGTCMHGGREWVSEGRKGRRRPGWHIMLREILQ